jgi:uncharacterized protein (DUF1778 family)
MKMIQAVGKSKPKQLVNMRLRIDVKTYKILTAQAASENRTLSNYILIALAELAKQITKK